MNNFPKKLEDATNKELMNWINTLEPHYTRLASDELTRRASSFYSRALIFLTIIIIFTGLLQLYLL